MVVDAAKAMINEVISDKLDFKTLGIDTSETFRLVDLGCSTGPNTFISVQNIVQTIEQKYKAEYDQNYPSSLEFLVFFNDHYGNDFNILFKTLPPLGNHFAAGVPGSFHGRLFPKSTLHFAHSSYHHYKTININRL
ncbi:S-adenosylmethionine-dependent methyltransferase [Melia azedarach]|uniref:S-adenosylmethionine-dependent methyltransferase n=1 Tax=Melia azedarach TaxID=155640 RepID=A0ACC1X9V1_MELAZ|nr:S-adenosylmethionine-dependent methyltransferase [Melia azedarach]